MYKVLIVDDERIERKGIKLLLQKMGVEIDIQEAVNGQEAFDYLKEQTVDILFTDVKMPFLDGIQLIEKIVPIRKEMKIIIFSGYGEFEYARIAIKMGVENYILKPVDPKEFEETVFKIIQELEEEKLNRELEKRNKGFMKEHILYSLVNGVSLETLKQKMTGVLDLELFKEYKVMFLLEFDKDFFGKIGMNFQDMLYRKFDDLFIYLNLNQQQCILFKRGNFKREGLESNNQRLAQEVRDFVIKKFGEHPYIAVSQEIKSLEEFPEYFDKLEILMENKFYQIETDIFIEDFLEQGSVLEQIGEDILMKQIKQDVRMKDIYLLKEHFERLCKKYKGNREFSQVYIKFIFSNLLKDFYENLPEMNEQQLNQEIDTLYKATDFSCVMEIVNKTIKRLESTFDQNISIIHKEVQEIIQYIYQHYSEDISVDMLADRVYMAPSYLSHIFKKETGKNLNKFIKAYRMEKAKEKLENTYEKIVNISYSVGYQNVSYFCQSFREYFGISPQKFRSQGENYEEDN